MSTEKGEPTLPICIPFTGNQPTYAHLGDIGADLTTL